MVFADVTECNSLNNDADATKASPLRSGWLVIRLNRKVFWLSEDHNALVQRDRTRLEL